MDTPGRVCPLHYRYQPEVFAREPDLYADTLLVAGGLYGNIPALETLLRLREAETRIVFAGDFNWFNATPRSFRAINETVLEHVAVRGNVETELAARSDVAGCGCAYPASVPDSEVEHSNGIMQHLRRFARRLPGLADRLGLLPMHIVARVGKLKVAIAHGDAFSLAGWGFAHDVLHASGSSHELERVFARARVDVFAGSHTCLPAMRCMQHGDGTHVVVNNGAAGMPNFSGSHYGVATRISVHPCPPAIRLYGTRVRDVYVDAVRIHYDQRAFLEQFNATWPPGSPAYASYFTRIAQGPDFTPDMALGLTKHAEDIQRTG